MKTKRGSRLTNSESFMAFVLDQLEPLRVVPRRMFGGIGLYHEDVFFGIIAADTLFLKVDDRTRVRYEQAGMPPFKPFPDRPASVNYYTVPVAVLESAIELERWAKEAIAAGRQRDAAVNAPAAGAARRPAARSSSRATAATSTAAARRTRSGR